MSYNPLIDLQLRGKRISYKRESNIFCNLLSQIDCYSPNVHWTFLDSLDIITQDQVDPGGCSLRKPIISEYSSTLWGRGRWS